MTNWIRRVGICLLCAITCAANADILLDWERAYHVNPNDESFTDVAIDNVGNVYAIGNSYNGSNFDAIVVKYGAGGGFHWAIKFNGAGDQKGRKIAVTPDGTALFVAYDSNPRRMWLRRLNPANGTTVWQTYADASAPATGESQSLLVDPTTSNVHWARLHLTSGVTAALVISAFTSAGANVGGFGTGLSTPNHKVLDACLRPGGGVIYLSANPAGGLPGASITGTDSQGNYLGNAYPNQGTGVASSPANGGVAYVIGRISPSAISIYRINPANMTLALNALDTFTGLTAVTVTDVVAGPDGNAYAMGYEDVAGKGKEWFAAKYAYGNLSRMWRTARPNTANDEFFRAGAVDEFGNLAVLGIRSGATDQIFTKVLDGATGNLIGQVSASAPSGSTNLFAIAANASGVFASAGCRQDVGFTSTYLTKVSQNGLKQITAPMLNYVGGQTVPCTVSMYAVTGASRTITLASNSPFVQPPANVLVFAANLTRSFNVATVPTSVDRSIVLSATWQGVTRQVAFTLRAPRPSSLSITPDTVTGGNSSTGLVVMTGAAPQGGLNVNLSSNGPEVIVPASISLAAGATQKSFQVNTSVVGASVTRTVSASANGVTKTDTLTVNP